MTTEQLIADLYSGFILRLEINAVYILQGHPEKDA